MLKHAWMQNLDPSKRPEERCGHHNINEALSTSVQPGDHPGVTEYRYGLNNM